MTVPIQVVFRNMERSDKLEEIVKEKASKMEKLCDRVTSCRVSIEIPHKHHKTGNDYEVTVDLSVPDRKIVVNRTAAGANGNPGDVYGAIKEAFSATKRQLEDYARKRRGELKLHEEVPAARITQLFETEGYGFLETLDGREIYFHSNSVVNYRFQKLSVGTEVTYVESMGEDGPQASTVKIRT